MSKLKKKDRREQKRERYRKLQNENNEAETEEEAMPLPYKMTEEVLAQVLMEEAHEEDEEDHVEVIPNIIELLLDEAGIKLNLTITMQGILHLDYESASKGHLKVKQDVADRTQFNFTNTNGQTFMQPETARTNYTVEKLVSSPDNATTLVAEDFDPAAAAFLASAAFASQIHTHIPELNILTVPSLGLTSKLHSTHEMFDDHDDHGGASYDYQQNGDDWATIFEECDEDFQSPINLLSPITKYGNSYKFYNFEEDNSNLEYVMMSEVPLLSFPDIHTVEMYLDHKDGYLGFTSHLGKEIFGSTDRWQAYEIQYRHFSEHTIDFKRFDVELQLFHVPHIDHTHDEDEETAVHRRLEAGGTLFGEEEEGAGEEHFTLVEEVVVTFDFSIIAMLFDAKNYDKSFTPEEVQWFYDFFDNLLFEYHLPTIANYPLNELMNRMDMDNRWVYKGSLTMPDCHRYVYWNVIQRIYPIREDQVEMLKKKLQIVGNPYDNGGPGAARNIQTKFNKEVFFVKSAAAWMGAKVLVLTTVFMSILW